MVAIPHPRNSTSSRTEKRARDFTQDYIIALPHPSYAKLSSRDKLGAVMQPGQQRREAVYGSTWSIKHSARFRDHNAPQAGPIFNVALAKLLYATKLIKIYTALQALGKPWSACLLPGRSSITRLLRSAFLHHALTRNHGRPAEQCAAEAAASQTCVPNPSTLTQRVLNHPCSCYVGETVSQGRRTQVPLAPAAEAPVSARNGCLPSVHAICVSVYHLHTLQIVQQLVAPPPPAAPGDAEAAAAFSALSSTVCTCRPQVLQVVLCNCAPNKASFTGEHSGQGVHGAQQHSKCFLHIFAPSQLPFPVTAPCSLMLGVSGWALAMTLRPLPLATVRVFLHTKTILTCMLVKLVESLLATWHVIAL